MEKADRKKGSSTKNDERLKKKATDLKTQHIADQRAKTLKELKDQGVSEEGIDEFMKFFGQCIGSSWDGC